MKRQPIFAVLFALSLMLNITLLSQLSFFNSAENNQQIEGAPNAQPFTLVNHIKPELALNSELKHNASRYIEQQTLPTPNKRAALLQQAEQWLQEQNYAELQLFLRDYLQQSPLDMDFLIIEAELNVQTELLSDAIAYFYSLQRLPMNAEQNQLINERISQLTSLTITQLQRAYSWDTLAIFVEPLLQLEPQNRSYILSLAEAYAQQQQFNLMENILASLDYDDPSAMSIRRMANQNQDQQLEQDDGNLEQQSPTLVKTRIKLSQLGDQYVVNAQLSGNAIALLIDTGASITAISRDYFSQLNNRYKINFVGRFSVNTANGKVLAPMYQFSELKLNHAIVNNISVVVLPMPNLNNINGLLGMNFLREFDFKIDQRQSELWLSQ